MDTSLMQRWPWGIGIEAAGVGFVLLALSKGVKTMEGQHWVMLLVVLVMGYVLGRIWATPAQLIGLA
jgi:hypothetical protein